MTSFKQIRVDPAAVSGGVWVPYVGTISCRIARLHNPAMTAFLTERLSQVKNEDFGQEHPVFKEAIARTVLVDWKGVDNDDGSPGERQYSSDAALEMFMDREYEDFYTWVLGEAAKFDRYRLETIEAAVGNSQNSSNGATNGAISRSTSKGRTRRVGKHQ